MEKYVGLFKNNSIVAANITHSSIQYEALSRGMVVSIKNKDSIDFKKYGYVTDEIGRVFEISDYNKKYLFNTSRLLNLGNINSKAKALKKENLAKTLKDNDFNFINTLKFTTKNEVNASLILDTLNVPLVVKPVNGTMGKGVYCDLKNKDELIEAIAKQNSDYMVEEYISNSDEYRVYTINSKVVALCKRLAPTVTGNGISSIEELVLEKNKKRSKIKLSSIKLNPTLDITYIPKQDEKIILSLVKGRSSGSEIQIIKNGIDLGILSEIERFASLFKENFVLGFDILVKNNSLYILEINTRPQISSAILPDIGDGVDFPKVLLDSLFGVSSSSNIDFSTFYKAYKSIIKTIDIEWEEIQCQVVNGVLETKIIV
ncbi:hypothetical protein B9T31_16920 [Acinetobacter sp. ANC 4558]|uniref:hypothetical protein n=1 Tax=Acinetobacter sp. ANC 4558 TaxID=1977876 RepID=UPI000A35C0E9|nr:hypothetical protein [Acinetobacter sp. ANC 4558]OTG79571.1 hypothetical protein B9T31_16920 [Acinetobacter sp. ANC 4558]